MTPFLILNIQSLLGLIAFSLIARWQIAPALGQRPLHDALAALCLIHAFRYVALGAFLPGQVSPDIPPETIAPIVYGDTLSGLLALIAAVMLKMRATGAIAAAWIFNIVGLADIGMSLPIAIAGRLYDHALGFSWYVFAFYVPLLIVTHIMMIAWLIRRKDRQLATPRNFF